MKDIAFIIPSHTDREDYLVETIKSINDVMINSNYTYTIFCVRSTLKQGDNINYALEHINSLEESYEFVKIIGNDDLLDKGIYHQIDVMLLNKDIDFSHSNSYNFFESGKIIKHIPKIKHPSLNDMLKNNQLHGGTIIYRYDVLNKIKWSNEPTAEEYDTNLNLLSKGYKLEYVDCFTYHYRRHDKQKSLGKGIDQQWRNTIKEKIKNKYGNK